MSGPKTFPDAAGRMPGETDDAWFLRTFGPMPAPTAAMDTPIPDETAAKRREALAALERTIPPVYRWSCFSAPELSARVPAPAIAQGQSSWREPRVCVMGVSRAGKTSLAVAMLREWVRASGRCGAFLAAYRLSTARLQHAAGHGEPEIVDLAFKAPLVLIDDLGCERDNATSAIPDILFERHAEDRPTWVTTGLTREQLVKRYGLGVVARVFERAKLIRVGDRPSSTPTSMPPSMSKRAR